MTERDADLNFPVCSSLQRFLFYKCWMLRCSGGCFPSLSGHPGSIQVHPKSIDLSRSYPKARQKRKLEFTLQICVGSEAAIKSKPQHQVHPSKNQQTSKNVTFFNKNKRPKHQNHQFFHKQNCTYISAQCNLAVSHTFQPQPLNFF